MTSIQSRVLPLLTDPPSRVRNVWLLMLNFERVTLMVLSKTTAIPVSEFGTLPINLDVYKFVVHGLLHLNTVLWELKVVSMFFSSSSLSVADSVQTEYCTTFLLSVCPCVRVSQA